MATIEYKLNTVITGHENPMYTKKISGISGADTILFTPQYFPDRDKTPGLWDLISCTVYLDTDGNAANRYIYIYSKKYRYSVEDQFNCALQSDVFVADKTGYFTVGRFNVFNAAHPVSTGDVEAYAGVGPYQMLASPNDTIQVKIIGGVAGDEYRVEIVLLNVNRMLGIMPSYSWGTPIIPAGGYPGGIHF